MRAINRVIKMDKEKYKVPRRVQDVIPIKRIWDDGIFLTGKRYAKTYQFSDINYLVASRGDKERMLVKYSEVLKSFDSSAMTKITINNRRMNRRSLENSVFMSMKHDGLDHLRDEYNKVILSKATEYNSIVQEKYITISVNKRNVNEARAYFNRMEIDLAQRFKSMGSILTPMDAKDKLRLLHDFYRSAEDSSFEFDTQNMMRMGHDFRDYLCPDSIEQHADYLKLGEKYARVLFMKDPGAFLDDDTLTTFMNLNLRMMISLDTFPIPTEEGIKEISTRSLANDTNITNWQRRQNSNMNFSAMIPYPMEHARECLNEYMEDINERDHKLMPCVVTMVHVADTKAQLDLDTKTIFMAAEAKSSQMGVLRFLQRAGLSTALPIGIRLIDAFRTMTTESAAAFMPFKAQEIQESGGIYFGENAVSRNLIFVNLNNLMNQSMMLLGTPGAGKSFMAKLVITFLILFTDADILILDPEGEYTPLVRALNGEVCRLAVGGKDYLNAMDVDEGYGEDDPVAMKSQFIMTLINQLDKREIGPKHKSVIDRCVGNVLREAEKNGTTPTLSTLRDELKKHDEKEAQDLYLTLELYTEGSISIFSHETNVDTNNRLLSFDIHDLGEDMQCPGYVSILDYMMNRVNRNFRKGKRTYIFVDEFHVVLKNEFSSKFFFDAWRQFRKRNAAPCAITQNVDTLFDYPEAKTMISNSEFIIMMKQAERDIAILSELRHISREQMGYVEDVPPGHGILSVAGKVIAFMNEFPKNTLLYELITTKPGEGKFARGAAEQYENERKTD